MFRPTEKTIAVAREAAQAFPDAQVEMIGAWVWITFPGKPEADVRAEAKRQGFRWVKRRGQWAHNCGVRTKSANGYHPREKYGTVLVQKDDEVAA